MQKTNSKTDWLTLELRKRIAQMEDGEPFPTVRQLIKEYGVSLPTVMAARERLRAANLLTAHVGRGSAVIKENSRIRRILLLQPDWAAPNMTMIVPDIKQAVENIGGEFRCETYDYRLDTPPSFLNYDADLIILDSPTGPQLAPENVESLVRSPVPVLLSRREVHLRGLNYISEDNQVSGAKVAAMLFQAGHRHVAVLYSEPRIEWNSSAIRLHGFQTFASLQGMHVEMVDCGIRPGELPTEAIGEFARRLQSGAFDFTAVFVISNSGAKELAERMDQLGLRIPETVSILTLGDRPAIENVSTFVTPAAEYIQALEKLMERLLNHTDGPTQINLPVAFLDRGSIRDLNATGKKQNIYSFCTQ